MKYLSFIALLLSFNLYAEFTCEFSDTYIEAINGRAQNIPICVAKKNGNPNLPVTTGGETPLLGAIRGQKTASINALLRYHNINLNHQDSSGDTALHFAVKNNDVELVSRLMRMGADLNKKGFLENTPLIFALAHQKWGIAHQLIDGGANPIIKGEHNKVAIFFAIDYDQSDLVAKLLRAGTPVDINRNFCTTPLMHSAQQNAVKSANVLLRSGAKINLKDEFNYTAYTYARIHRQRQVYDLIKAAGGRAEASGFSCMEGRLEPEIMGAVVLENQLAVSKLGVPLFNSSFNGSDYKSKRLIFVYGKNLPREHREVTSLVAPNSPITYSAVYYYENDKYDTTPVRNLDIHDKLYPAAMFDRGWKKVLRTLSEEDRNMVANRLEAVIIEASLPEDVKMGQKSFRLNGHEAKWPLIYGNHMGVISFAYEAAENEYENSQDLFIGQSIRLKIKTRSELPQSQLKIVIGKIKGEEKEISNITGTQDGTIVARKNPDDPTEFITPPITLLDYPVPVDARELNWYVNEGDILQATVTGKDFLHLLRPIAKAKVSGDRSEFVGQWKKALLSAATCKNIGPTNPGADMDTFLREARNKTAEEITNYYPTSILFRYSPPWSFFGILDRLWGANMGKEPFKREIKIKLADQAASILLKKQFIKMMEKAKEPLEEINFDSQVKTFGQWLYPQLKQKNSPLAHIKVAAPEKGLRQVQCGDVATYIWDNLFDFGPSDIIDSDNWNQRCNELRHQPVNLSMVADLSTIKYQYDLNDEEAKEWAMGALREGARKYLAQVEQSITLARDTDNCDVEGLLRLTGVKFDPVVKEMKKYLFHEVKNGNQVHYEADGFARAQVGSLHILSDAVRAQEKYANIDTQFMLTTLSLVAVPLGASSLALSWGLNIADMAVMTAIDIPEFLQSRRDLEFGAGGTLVLGNERYQQALKDEKEWWELALNAGGVGLGVIPDSIRSVRQVKRFLTARRLARHLDDIEGSGLSALLKNRRMANDVGEALTEARRLRDELGEDALGPVYRRLLEQEDRLQREALALLKNPLDIPGGLFRDGGAASSDVAWGNATRALREASKGHDQAKILENILSTHTDPKVAREAKNHLNDMEFRRKVLQDAIDNNNIDELQRLGVDDLNWLSGAKRALTEQDANRIRQTVMDDFNGHWSDAVKSKDLNLAQRHQLTFYRKSEVDKLLDQSMDEIRREIKRDYGIDVKLERKAFGSNNLTSDYDLSIDGLGAELVVRRFNEKFRRAYGGIDSGVVFDTNVYTDPVYNMIRGADTTAGNFRPNALNEDEFRQTFHSFMGARKDMTKDQWEAYTRTLRDAAPNDEVRRSVDHMVSQVDSRYATNSNRLNQSLEDIARQNGLDLSKPAQRAQAEFQATNNLYADSLDRINQLRFEHARLSKLTLDSQTRILDQVPANFLSKNPAYRKVFEDIDAATAAGRLDEARALKTEAMARLAHDMRNRQGDALFWANEAYLTQGTIGHVVGEVQAGGKKITYEYLTGKPRRSNLSQNDYLRSLRENIGKANHELHKLDQGGGVYRPSNKAAAKAAKYFIRQLGAAHQGGIDLSSTLGRNFMGDEVADAIRQSFIARGQTRNLDRRVNAALLEMVTEVDRVRGNLTSVTNKLSEFGITPDQFVDMVVRGQSVLTNQSMQRGYLFHNASRISSEL